VVASLQTEILAVCAELVASDFVYESFDPVSGDTYKEVKCWMDDFKEYRQDNSLSFPVEGDADAAVLEWREASVSDGTDFKWDKDLGYVLDGCDIHIYTFICIYVCGTWTWATTSTGTWVNPSPTHINTYKSG